MSQVLFVTDENFDDFIAKSIKPVVVDFWAKWCAPCKMITPILNEISTEQEDIIIAKLEVDENPKTAAKYNIRSIPTLIIFKEGKPLMTKTGSGTKLQIQEFISKNIKN